MIALFVYRVSKEANLARDTVTGKPVETQISFSIKDQTGKVADIKHEDYSRIHEQSIPILADLHNINPDFIRKISVDMYEG